jgi:phenylacetate-CoA ligase
VIDFYDSHEFNMIGWECQTGALYHVSDLSMIAEVVKDGRAAGPGEDGELVGTALHSWAMPFIRFRLGDLVTRGPQSCSCGAANSTLTRIQGRLVDRFVLLDGYTIHPYTLVRPLLTGGPWIQRFQIVQKEAGRILVKIVPLKHEAPGTEILAQVERALTRALGGRASVFVELVESIPPDANGKFRPYVSQVGS